MNIIIGVRDTVRELALDVDMDEAALTRLVGEAVATGSVLELTDVKGQRTLVPSRAIGFVQIVGSAERRVGFAID
ncbi:DUF3107 domain-containing protein [Actinomyces sp. B33]|uniref:DUF3107 domain-containing protein n=1 Tax=Actinomyces sp. B33 TaxID=2942131 RepID=UPI00233FC2D2|nr:DUF3107 domain-containing protein [Actinomyces sp. B33]MDC4233793.1 DUF3107 domain-containing protein [Actinomyces sp. B33]